MIQPRRRLRPRLRIFLTLSSSMLDLQIAVLRQFAEVVIRVALAMRSLANLQHVSYTPPVTQTRWRDRLSRTYQRQNPCLHNTLSYLGRRGGHLSRLEEGQGQEQDHE